MFSAAFRGVNPAIAESEGRRVSVLVVDDERGPRESLKLILGYHFGVFDAETGEEALRILQREPIDVVTLDLKMPGMSGPEILTRMRAIDPLIEVVVVTGYGSFDSAVEVLRLRAFDYVTKPFDPEVIQEIVRRAGEHRRHTRETGESLIAPLDEMAEDASLLEAAAASRLPDPDRAAIRRIRQRLAELRERALGRPPPAGALGRGGKEDR